jgi:2-phospho-L-lactate guanylyltransferase
MRIIVPVKPLSQAKSRLGTALSPGERADVMRRLLDRVIAAASQVSPVSVVTADPEIAHRSRTLGAEVIDEGVVLGLDSAARLGLDRARRLGEEMVMILAADLPDVTAEVLRAMTFLARPGAMVIGPSQDGGTNALILPSKIDFCFAYGPDSLVRHQAEARRLGLEIVVHEAPALRLDVDWPGDLADQPDLWAA